MEFLYSIMGFVGLYDSCSKIVCVIVSFFVSFLFLWILFKIGIFFELFDKLDIIIFLSMVYVVFKI